MHDYLVIGAGIFGLTTAISLAKKGYKVALLDAGSIPHPLAASTDISKVVRMEYGTDREYMDMAHEAIKGWRSWNQQFNDTLFHETGFILLSPRAMEEDSNSFEAASVRNLTQKGFQPTRLSAQSIVERYPVFSPGYYTDGFYHAVGGFAESARTVCVLADYARQLGVEIHENQTALPFTAKKGRIETVATQEGKHFSAGHIIVCAGNFTPILLPELASSMRVTGHPVFHLKPSRPELFQHPQFGVFAADISGTGWYGFPLHPTENVVKISNHSAGRLLDPAKDDRKVTQEQKSALRTFLKEVIPALADDPIVYTRLCCYTDTLDGHFWIDNHPTITNLTVGSGGSGHGFKMGPIIGDMIATVAEGNNHKWSDRFKWREFGEGTVQAEEARKK